MYLWGKIINYLLFTIFVICFFANLVNSLESLNPTRLWNATQSAAHTVSYKRLQISFLSANVSAEMQII